MYCHQHTGVVRQEAVDKFLSSLYTNAEQIPKHYFAEDSETIQIRSNKDEVIATCTIFNMAFLEEYLVLGNYECIDDQKVASELFSELEKKAIEKGKQFLLGPMNGNTWQPYRFSMLDKAPFLFEHRHKKHYPQQWMNLGFEINANYHTNIETIDTGLKLEYNDFFERKELRLRSFDIENVQDDLRSIYELSMKSFSLNPFFQEISWNNFYALYKNVLPHVQAQFIDMVFDADKFVGFLFAQPDSYQPNRLIIKTLARLPGRKYAGMGRGLRNRVRHKCVKNGFDTMLHAYIYEENYSNVLSHNVGSNLYQHHALLSKKI